MKALILVVIGVFLLEPVHAAWKDVEGDPYVAEVLAEVRGTLSGDGFKAPFESMWVCQKSDNVPGFYFFYRTPLSSEVVANIEVIELIEHLSPCFAYRSESGSIKSAVYNEGGRAACEALIPRASSGAAQVASAISKMNDEIRMLVEPLRQLANRYSITITRVDLGEVEDRLGRKEAFGALMDYKAAQISGDVPRLRKLMAPVERQNLEAELGLFPTEVEAVDLMKKMSEEHFFSVTVLGVVESADLVGVLFASTFPVEGTSSYVIARNSGKWLMATRDEPIFARRLRALCYSLNELEKRERIYRSLLGE